MHYLSTPKNILIPHEIRGKKQGVAILKTATPFIVDETIYPLFNKLVITRT